MNVTLITPPSPFLIDEYVNPPLNIGYLSSYLKKHGYETSILHLTTGMEVPEIVDGVVGISMTTPQYNLGVKIMNEIKKQGGNHFFIAGGIHPSVNPQECLNDGFDSVVVGEGEKALLDIVKKQTRGIVYGEQETNLDMIPIPDYDTMNISKYTFNFNNLKSAIMFTSRGCPGRCSFCSSQKMFAKVRFNSVDYVKNHIDVLIDKYKYEMIMFMDDVFTLKKDRVREIAEYMKTRGIPYRCLARADIKLDIIDILADTGCLEVGIGIESGNQRMLDVMNKRTSVEQNKQVILAFKNKGIKVKVFTLIGCPSETKESIEDTIRLLEETQPDDVDSNVLVPYPGTAFYDNMKDYDLFMDVVDYDKMFMKGKIGEYNPVVHTSSLTSEEIAKYKWEIFNRFSKLSRNK